MRRAALAAATFVVACVLAVSAGQPPEAVTVSPEIALAAPLPEPCAGTSPECGERAAATAALAPRFEVTAHGTDVIETVEILRYSEPDGGFRVIYDLRPNALDFTWSGRDGGFRDDAIYYLRLRQRSPVRGREVMAWSSPVWVNAR